MSSRFLCVLALLITCVSATTAIGAPSFGRFSGTLQHAALGQQQLAKLDFVVSRQDSRELRLVGILSVYFGDFSSTEYVTYHFDDVRYDLLNGTLIFDQPDQDVTLVVRSFNGSRIEGELRSAVAGDIGRLTLNQGEAAHSTLPLIQPVWGEYRGICRGISTRLQIQTTRSSEGASGGGSPFGTYDITAQRAEDDPSGCLGTTTSCVWNVYDSGSYDFHAGRLSLYGQANDLDCSVATDGLTCNDCELRRWSREAVTATDHGTPRQVASWPRAPEPGRDGTAVETPVEGIQGEYVGYVHHERLDVFQPASVNIVTFQDSDPGSGTRQLRMSAVGTLYFGPYRSAESIAYRFDEQTYNLLSPQVVFQRVGSDVDAIVQVTSLANGEIKGVWYSLLFGRVGEFIMRKSGAPELPSGAKVFEPVAARYDGPDWVLGLRVARESASDGSANPFSPLNFKGYMRMPQITPNLPIAGGSYDFYTGKMTIKLENGSIFSGSRPSRQRLLLKRPTPGAGRPLLPHAPQTYNLVAP